MVSFNCDSCGDVLTKVCKDHGTCFFGFSRQRQGKIKNHAMRCRIGKLSCLDCNTDFAYPSAELDAHTSCISEADKYGHNKNKKRKQTPKKEEYSKAAQVIEVVAAAKTTKEEVEQAKQLYKQAKKNYRLLKKRYKAE